MNNDLMIIYVTLTNLPVVCLPNLACLSLGHQSLSFPPACPVFWSRRNGHQWFFFFSHPPSFFPVPPFSCLCSKHPSTLSSVFLFFLFRIVSCLLSVSSGRLLTFPNHFNRLSVTFLDIFATPAAPRMYSFLILSFCMLYHLRILHAKYVS